MVPEVGILKSYWFVRVRKNCETGALANHYQTVMARRNKRSWDLGGDRSSQDVTYELCLVRLTDVPRTDPACKMLETMWACVTNEIALRRTWELITGTISKCTASWMSCSRIYKITLTRVFFLPPRTWQDCAFAKRALWGSFRKSCIDMLGKGHQCLRKRWMDAF